MINRVLVVCVGNICRIESPLFNALRDRSQLKGKCGVCEYVKVCGGSRARAFAVTGDYHAAEPFCAHVPRRYQERSS